MIALLLGGASAFGLLVWHMQRRARAPVVLSFARLLPEPKPAARPEPRFAPTLPLTSIGFWLRIAAALGALAAMLINHDVLLAQSGEAVALRIVVDVTDSMSLPEGSATRFDAAKVVIANVLDRLGPNGTLSCVEVVPVGATIGQAGALAALHPLPEGGDAGLLRATAQSASKDCQPTHVLVLTDAVQPAGDWPEGGPVLIWHQIGAPVANAGIRQVTLTAPGLSAAQAGVNFEVDVFGLDLKPGLDLAGPGGKREVPLLPDPDRPSVLQGTLPLTKAGSYLAALRDGGAYGADDVVAFTVPDLPRHQVDWRLAGWKAPANLEPGAGPDVLLVAALDQITPADLARPLLATYDGWQGGGQAQAIGAFTEDADLRAGLNLDAFEAHAPMPLQAALPPGFVPVLTDAASGRAFAARRLSPPGLIVPAPVASGDDQVTNLSLTLFFDALSALTSGGTKLADSRWQDAGGRKVALAWKESDTARALAPTPTSAIEPAPRPAKPSPLTPYLILAVLAMILTERVLALWPLMQRRSRAV